MCMCVHVCVCVCVHVCVVVVVVIECSKQRYNDKYTGTELLRFLVDADLGFLCVLL
jgi:hypothetical protein